MPFDDAVDLLRDALGIYSPTTKEAKLASFLSSKMKDYGYSVEIDQAGNVLGEAGGGPIRILLCGHMDTVPGKLKVHIQGNEVYGRGSVDAKSALCAILLSGRRFLDSDQVHLTVACVTREEGNGLGIQTLIRSGRGFDYAIFGEPGGSGRITVGYRGRFGLQVKAKTEGGHASSPWAHLSALDSSLALVSELKKYEKANTLTNDHYRSLSICTTMMRAGAYDNVIPRECKMALDVRVPIGSSCDQISTEINKIAEAFRTENKAVQMEVDFGEPTEPYETNPGSTIVRAFQRAIIMRTQRKPMMVRKTGTGDMNTFAHSRKCPCVTYGPGDSKFSHTQREHIQLDDYLCSIEVLATALQEVASLHE